MSRRKKFCRVLIVLLLAGVLASVVWWGRECGAEWYEDVFAELSDEQGPGQVSDAAPSDLQLSEEAMDPTPEPTAEPTPEPTPELLPKELDFAALDEFCSQQTGGFSVYIQDLISDQVYLYDGDIQYYPASTLKAAYALWLCQRAEAGEIDFQQDLPNVYGSGGLSGSALSEYDGAAAVPVWDVIHKMIACSDNDAVTMLASAWPAGEAHGFCDFLASLGFSTPYSCTITVDDGIQGIMTVQDAGLMMKALYDYFETGSDTALQLQGCFLDAVHTALYVPEGTPAAKKYGSWDYAFHDLAIVYADHPYILCCMTDWGDKNIDFPAAAVESMQALGRMVYAQLNT